MRMPPDVLKLRLRPSCGHKRLVECPLDERDWAEIYRAWRAFRAVCLSVAEASENRSLPEGNRDDDA